MTSFAFLSPQNFKFQSIPKTLPNVDIEKNKEGISNYNIHRTAVYTHYELQNVLENSKTFLENEKNTY